MECLKTDFDVRWSKTSAATIPKETTCMFILDYVIYRIVAVILEMFWDKIVLGSRLYNTQGYYHKSNKFKVISKTVLNNLYEEIIKTKIYKHNENSVVKVSVDQHDSCSYDE